MLKVLNKMTKAQRLICAFIILFSKNFINYVNLNLTKLNKMY